jgi:hypothetical protein
MQIVNLAERPEFVPTLAAWHHAQWGELNPQNTLEARIERMQRHLDGEPIPVTFVAVEDDAPVGSASLCRSAGRCGRRSNRAAPAAGWPAAARAAVAVVVGQRRAERRDGMPSLRGGDDDVSPGGLRLVHGLGEVRVQQQVLQVGRSRRTLP